MQRRGIVVRVCYSGVTGFAVFAQLCRDRQDEHCMEKTSGITMSHPMFRMFTVVALIACIMAVLTPAVSARI